MLIREHPTCVVGHGEAGPEWLEWRHAKLWLVVDLPIWEAHRSGHLHVVNREEWEISDWRLTSIEGYPMRPTSDDTRTAGLSAGGVAGLEAWLRTWTLELYRQPDVGLVSELGEGEGAFRKRLLGGIRPELQRRAQSLERPEQERRQLAAGVAQLASAIERHTVTDASQAVQRVEVGVLIAPEDLHLDRLRPRTDPMV